MAGFQSAWGIDVGVTSLKAIKLRKDGPEVWVEAFDVVEHEHFLTEPDINRDETIRLTLQKFLERNALRREAVFIGVPGSSTFARFVKLPPVEPKKIPEIVKFEAVQQIPFPLEQVNWDYQTFANPDSPEVEVGIFAMKKELVNQVMANFTSTAMIVEGVQMSPLALYNAAMFDDMTGGKGTIVLDIGAEHTDLVFVDTGRIWLRTINIGGNNFTDALSKSFKVTFHKAEQLKRTAATSKYQKQIYQAMRPVFADLVADIQRSKGFYDSAHRDSKLERMIAMGNPFKLPNLQKYIQQEMKMEVVRIDGFRKAQVSPKIAAGLNEHILSLGGAFGLAIQGLDLATIDTNLLPSDIARQQMWRQKRPWFMGAAAAIVAGVGISAYSVWNDQKTFAQNQDSSAARADQQLVQEAQSASGEFAALPESQYTDNNAQIMAVTNLADDRKVWPQIYHSIMSALPQAKYADRDAWIKYIQQTPRESQKIIMIRGISSTYTTNLTAPAGSMAPAAPGGPRGFALEISGYTPYNPADGSGGSVVKDFVNALIAAAPETNKESRFYFQRDPNTPGGYTLNRVSATAAAVSTKGGLWEIVGPDMLGLRSTGAGGGADNLTAVLAAMSSKPLDPDTKGPMDNYYLFTVPLRVIVREAAAVQAPAPAAPAQP